MATEFNLSEVMKEACEQYGLKPWTPSSSGWSLDYRPTSALMRIESSDWPKGSVLDKTYSGRIHCFFEGEEDSDDHSGDVFIIYEIEVEKNPYPKEEDSPSTSLPNGAEAYFDREARGQMDDEFWSLTFGVSIPILDHQIDGPMISRALAIALKNSIGIAIAEIEDRVLNYVKGSASPSYSKSLDNGLQGDENNTSTYEKNEFCDYCNAFPSMMGGINHESNCPNKNTLASLFEKRRAERKVRMIKAFN